jgi:class 3 adenylate cyclase/predicted ATPase
VTCPSCGTANEAGRKFCGECGAKLAAVCGSCGAANAPTARFCGECGSALAGAATRPVVAAGLGPPGSTTAGGPQVLAVPVAERRLVTVLFADLVGFTTLSEGRDPETVRELLTRYFELAQDVIGRYGGTVEKFIGDAVMAIWGAPTAHEDDAERAVRAALDLVDGVSVLGPGIQARCGVLTGEAAVTIGAKDQGMVAGDLVNTAARLQSVAQPGWVLAGESTQRATTSAIAYEAAGTQELKGKSAPVPAWRALRVVAERRGRGRDDRLEAPFVGRDPELRLLKDLFHATARERRVRLVSITGQGGIGKSRLAWEFLKYVDGVVEQVWWHEGRSPAYGEGITFWALGEMVRSRAKLLETDDPATTRARIAEVVAEHVPDETERRRVEPALLALLGAGEAPAGGAAELFSAWRIFFERLASTGVVALLFEDLQWADAGTLDFIEHMLEWSRNVPVLIVTLARPDLLDRRPAWGAGKRSFLALDLQPLDDESMRGLLAGLVPGLPEVAARSIVVRAEGIPLYAVETIRMLVADGRLVERAGGGYEPAGELGELAVPDTLHALIAARLDALDPADRVLIQDASVLGQSFHLDALAAVAGLDRQTAVERLDRLARLDLLRVEVDPRSPEQGQYTFVQALIREVAYSTLALRDRRARHLAAARHFEAVDEEELAGALAAHYLAAYKASAEGQEAEALAGQARIALKAAATRAIALGAPNQALTFLVQAIEVTPDPMECAALHEEAGNAAGTAMRNDLALEQFEAALALFTTLGDRSAQARLEARAAGALGSLRRRDEAVARLEAVFPRYEDLGDEDPGLVRFMKTLASARLLTRDYANAVAMADRCLAAAERLGMAREAAELLNLKGAAASYAGRLWEARALFHGGRQLAEETGYTDVALNSMVALPGILALDSPAESLAVQRDAIALARRIGDRGSEVAILFNATEDARRTGDWEWAIRETQAAEQLDVDETAMLANRTQSCFYRAYQGTLTRETVDEIGEALMALEDADMHAGSHDLAGSFAHSEGRWSDAADQWLQVQEHSDLNAPYALPKAARVAILARDPARARLALDRLAALGVRGRAIEADRTAALAGIAALEGDEERARAGYRTALAAYRDLGLPWDEALAVLEAVSVLGPDGQEAHGWIADARSIFARLGAVTMLVRLDEAAAGETPAPDTAVGSAARGATVATSEPAGG